MRTYLDASVLVAFFLTDAHTEKARQIVMGAGELLLSDFAAAEFSSAIAGFCRVGRLDADSARGIFSDFDIWCLRTCRAVALAPSDIRTGEQFMRRLDPTLRTPDALHVAAAGRLQADLATFDIRMAEAAVRLGVALVEF